MTSALTNQRRVFKACLTQTGTSFFDDVTRKIGPLDFNQLINWQYSLINYFEP